MSTFDEDEIRLIDSRVRLHQITTLRKGTLQSRDTTGPWAMVTFHGATTAVAVKVLGSVFAVEGSPVVLGLFEGANSQEWYVVGSFAADALGEASKSGRISPTTGALTSATYVDLTEFGTHTFTKVYDATTIRVQMTVSAFASVANTQVEWAFRMTPQDSASTYVPADLDMNVMHYNQINTHGGNTFMRRFNDVPAGTYTIGIRWKRVSGTGNVNSDNGDKYAIELDERVRTSVPIL